MSEYIDWDMVFIVGDETYLDSSVVQTATLNISAAYVAPRAAEQLPVVYGNGVENIFREEY